MHFRTHYYADWKFGLSDTFDQYEQVDFDREWVADFAGAAYYGDTWTGAVGLLTARRPTSTSPEQAVEQTMVDVLHILNVFEPTYRSELVRFQTHDGHAAATQTFVFETDPGWSPVDLRDRLLRQNLRYYQLDTVPTHTYGTPHSRLRVGVTSTRRRAEDRPTQAHNNIIILPESTHEAHRYARRQFDNAIDTTNLAARDSGTRMGCERFPANESPKTDFYWMLDQSRSMEGHWGSVLDFATLFVDTLSASGLDYRLGVATMDRTFLGGLTQDALWHTDRATFLGELEDIAQDPYGAEGELHDDDEYGLKMAREGLTYMLGLEGNHPSDAVRIRDDADVATIFVADEDPESFQQYPLGSSSGQRLLDDYDEFFDAHSTVHALTTSDAWGYRQVALDTGGSYAPIHGSTDAARNTIEQWLLRSIAEASTYQLEQTPISSSMMVFKNGRWVPRSLDEGYAYFPQTNSIVFFGRFRPEPAEDGGRGDYVAVHYRTFSPAPK